MSATPDWDNVQLASLIQWSDLHGANDLSLKLACACFDAAEALLCRPDRSPHDDERATLFARASVYYAARDPKQDRRMLAASCWLASRVAGDVGNASACEGFAKACSIYATGLNSVFQGYACDALARSWDLRGDSQEAAALRSRGLSIAISIREETGSEHCLTNELLDSGR